MLEIPTRVRYALRALTDMGGSDSKNSIPVQEISKRQGISHKYLENIFHQLKKSGLVVSTRGPEGGYRLAKKPEEITVYEIILALEGPLTMVHCLSDEELCPRGSVCGSRDFWADLQGMNKEFLSRQTLQTIMERYGEKEEARLYETNLSG